MPISFTCGTCGKPYKVDGRFAGKKAACRACGTINKIPSAQGVTAAATPGASAPGRPTITPRPVPAANTPDTADDDLTLPLALVEDEEVNFDPVADAAGDANTEAGVIVAEEADDELAPVDVIDRSPAPFRPTLNRSPNARTPVRALPVTGCPECGASLEPGAVFCTGCGYNLKTGQRVSTVEGGDDREFIMGRAVERVPTPALRASAKWLIIGGVVLSVLPILTLHWRSLSGLGSASSLVGALMCMVGTVAYFIDGAFEGGAIGAGTTVASLIILVTVGLNSGPVPVAVAPPPPPAPATVPASKPAPPPKVEEVSPGRYVVRPPAPGEDPLEYWRPVIAEPDVPVRTIVIGQLAQVPEIYREGASELIADCANDADVRVRRAAMAAIAVGRTPKSVAAATQGLNDADIDVVRKAVRALGQFHEESAIDTLVGKYPTVGDPVLVALAGYGPASKEKVAEAYKRLLSSGGGELNVRLATIARIVQLDPENAGPALLALVGDGDAAVRTTAISRLADLHYTPAIPAIVERLGTDANAASDALIKFGPDAAPAVAAKLTDGDPKIKLLLIQQILKPIVAAAAADPQAAAAAMAPAVPTLRTASRDTDLQVALAARDVWRKLEPTALPPLEEAVADLDATKDFQARALQILKTLPVDSSQQAAVSRKLYDLIVANPEAPIPTLACDALMVWSDRATRDKMIDLLKPDADDAKRAQAIRMVIQSKDPRAVRPLCECLAQNRDLENVCDALREFGPVSETYLMRLVSTGDPTIQVNACNLLREIGTRRCFMVLSPIVNKKDADADSKKRARDTMIAINRRLNSAAAAARKAPPLIRPPTPPATQQ